MKKVRLIAVIAALIAGIGIYFFLREVSKPKEVPHTNVVVAKTDIPENTMLTEEMVELRSVVNEALQENHLLDLKSAIGMVASGNIYAGEQVTKNRLVRAGELDETNKSLAYIVENGMRAVTISVNTVSGMENLVKPGNRVDLVVNYTYTPKGEDAGTGMTGEEEKAEEEVRASKMLAQNLRILASGKELAKTGAQEYVTLTLETTPEEALMISYAEYTGTIKVLLRSALDNTTVEMGEVDIDVLRGEDADK